MVNLSTMYATRQQGDRAENPEQAIATCRQALEVLSPRDEMGAWTAAMNNLAIACRLRVSGDRSENLEQAIAIYDRVLDLLTLEAMPVPYASTLLNRGIAHQYRVRGDYISNQETSIATYKQALGVFSDQIMPVKWARTSLCLASAYATRLRGDTAANRTRAIDAYQQVLQVFHSDRLPAERRRAAMGLGDVYLVEHRWQEAVSAYDLALAVVESPDQATGLRSADPAERAEVADLYRLAAYALARHGDLARTVVTLERGCGRSLSQDPDFADAEMEQTTGDAEGTYQPYPHGADALQASEIAEPPGSYSAGLLAATEIRTEAKVTTALRPGEPGFDEVAKAVRPGCPLVYLNTTPHGSLVLIIHTLEACGGTEVSVDSIAISDLTTRDFESYLHPRLRELPWGLPSSDQLQEMLAAILPFLGEKLIMPIAARLRELGTIGVHLIPGGFLKLFPLHAARYPGKERSVDLLAEFEVSYEPSAQVLAAARDALRARRSSATVLAGVAQGSLSWTRGELEAVATLFAPDSQRLLWEDKASQDALVRALLGATHVDLACHYRPDPEDPQRAHLGLAAEEPVRMRDILQRNVLEATRLVVLSGSYTAAPVYQSHPDESVSLAARFLQAGVPGVVGTLWNVDDPSAALLVVKLYKFHLKGDRATREGPMAPACALRRAQLWLREVTAGELVEYFDRHRVLGEWRRGLYENLDLNDSVEEDGIPEELGASGASRFLLEDPESRPFADPYYWAPFIVLGV
ncbi:MAG: CHAT domain-containing protein [bacterium]|nr:CHAT domain-containing protein [bacterium]